MKTLSLKQLEIIKECVDEIKIGVYDYQHMKNVYNLIDAHYDDFEFYSPTIREWYKRNYKPALSTAMKREINKRVKKEI